MEVGGVMQNYFDLFIRSLPLLVSGVQMTLKVLFLAASLSVTLGTFFGVLSCKQLKVFILSPIIEIVTFMLRSIPFYVQLMIVYFVLPDLLGINFDPFPAAVLALGLCSSGYVAQIIRAGMNSIPAAQWESAFVLGYSKPKAVGHIILPQALSHILPAISNELDALLKSTAIVSTIGLLELTRAGMNLVSREMEPIPIYLMVAFFYLCLSLFINLITRLTERKLAIC